jgi:hypothetical protein
MKRADFIPGKEAVLANSFGTDGRRSQYADKQRQVVLDDLDDDAKMFAYVTDGTGRSRVLLSRLSYPKTNV